MKNDFIYRVVGFAYIGTEYKSTVLGHWLSLGRAKADIKHLAEIGFYQKIIVEKVKIGRFAAPQVVLESDCR